MSISAIASVMPVLGIFLILKKGGKEGRTGPPNKGEQLRKELGKGGVSVKVSIPKDPSGA